MKPRIVSLLDEASKKMSAYAALLRYRFQNLSIEAAPEALLSVQVMVNGVSTPIEKTAYARNAPDREDQFEIYPMDRDLLLPILAGLKMAHPEYKIELLELDDSEDQDGVKDKYILATMPEVDDDRHDLLTNAVDTLSDACAGLMDGTITAYTAKIALLLQGGKPEEIDEAKDALQNIRDKHDEMCKQYKEDKEAEIEQAYKEYKQRQEEKKAGKEEEDNALAGLKMNWKPEDDD